MYDAVALGELLIDFTPESKSERGNPTFEQNPGGAPANVLALLAQLGKKTAFMGKVGADPLGEFLSRILSDKGIDVSGLVKDADVKTTLAFVHLAENGERSFQFYRNPGADMMLQEKELKKEIIRQTKLFHFGSLSLTDEPVRSATYAAVREAKQSGAVISYDPNLRPALWESLEQAKAEIKKGLELADIVKLSEEELEFLTGDSSLESGAKAIFDRYDVKLVLVTLGANGSFYFSGEGSGKVEGFPVRPVDTTGAGDAFFGGFLYQWLEQGNSWQSLRADVMRQMLRFANAAGGLVTTQKGAISSLPTLEQIEQLVKKHQSSK